LNLLLDTNVLLWWLMDNPSLSARARQAILEADLVYVSPASFWEIEIKKARGNLDAPERLADVALARGLRPLPITIAHAVTAGRLPEIHHDPFDRMLVAQAIDESLTLLTADRVLARYSCRLIRA
jgi:PIN domain nuclease of toxin-antitoxin system